MVEHARVWRGGDEAGTAEQGIKIFGTPLGHPDFVRNQLQHVREHQQMLLDQIPLISVVVGSLAPLRSSPGELLHSGGASGVVG